MTFEKIKVVQKMLSNEKTVSNIQFLTFIGDIDAKQRALRLKSKSGGRQEKNEGFTSLNINNYLKT